ncbi:DUF3995 domain-containing protein [Pseudomonas sp. 6D_7.1_Bac1]|uniref:DUF3995 domain-containing protein n=1 Tax=Pseudomonas sp. 6D_7.1_Bac1 TaxID=2971615 RepID=UPI0021C6B084|nr:DUF3995 domain-containing protein [Pseudomonas sp. 6D_7.1_Bac1]MCU1749066.1 DUF3995 domain-containing protein [Pseudomonas sp. 6D_7.1_Bac1]
MTFVLAQWIVAAFVLISLIHLYWALGGQWASDAVVPQVQDGAGEGLRPAFKPSTLATLAVALGLLLIALMVSLRVGLFVPAVGHWSLQWLISAIALLMFARAIGDSNLVGFFKEQAGSKFARLDTWAYSPLCVVLGAGLLAVAWT